MRGYQEGDDLRRIHWPSVARTGELMIRQDESTRRASGLVFLDTRATALGRTHDSGFRARGLRGRLGRRPPGSPRVRAPPRHDRAPGRALSEERFLDALAGISHAEVRSIGPALAHLRAGASPDTSLVFVSAPPVPAELSALIRSRRGLRSEARRS